MVAAAVGVSAAAGLAGSAMQSSASQSAANTQAQAANNASGLQWNMFQQLQQNQQPYMNLGQTSIGQMESLLNIGGGGLLNNQFSFNPTMQQLEQTPGYQFTLNRGEQAVNNQMAAQGLNLSGPQGMALANYASGLASQTYQQQYQNALTNFQTNYNVGANQYSRLAGLVGLGQNAAAGVGNAGIQTGANMSNTLTSGAAASAAGTIGSANAASNGLSSLGSNGLLYSLMNPSAGGGAFYGNSSAAGTSTPQDLIAGYTG